MDVSSECGEPGAVAGEIIKVGKVPSCQACIGLCGQTEGCKGWSFSQNTCTVYSHYLEAGNNSNCRRGRRVETCYPKNGLSGVASITRYLGNSSSAGCLDKGGVPGCWKQDSGRVGSDGAKVDYRVAVPYAWFSNKGAKLYLEPKNTGGPCTSDATCPSEERCIGGQCWKGVTPGNCGDVETALTIQCTGGGFSSCTDDSECASGTCMGGRCLSQNSGMCQVAADCKGYNPSSPGQAGCGANKTCWSNAPSSPWGACGTKDVPRWRVVQGESISFPDGSTGDPVYVPGTPLCWALAADKATLEQLNGGDDAKHCNNMNTSGLDKCIVVQADNTCGGNCACLKDSCREADGATQANSECNTSSYAENKQCDSLQGGDLYAMKHRCVPGQVNAETESNGGWPTISTLPGVDAPSTGWAPSDSGGDAVVDWCDGRYVHFDMRASSVPPMLPGLSGAAGSVAYAHFKQISCPPQED